MLLDFTSISLADYFIEEQPSETIQDVKDKYDLVFQKVREEDFIDEANRSTNQILGLEKKQSINRGQKKRNGCRQKPNSIKNL